MMSQTGRAIAGFGRGGFLSRLRTWGALPWHVLCLFTMAKSFRDNPVIGSRALNRMGLHVWRIRVAHAVFAFRQMCLSYFAGREEAAFYRDNGYLVIEDFLPPQEFAALKQEAEGYCGEAFETVQGDTATWRAFLERDNLARLPACRALAHNRRFRHLLAWCGGRNEKPLFYIQQIRSNVREGVRDPQKILHADTFHPTMKAWLFLQDVGEDGCPFTYVPGSNRPTRARLRWEHARSQVAAGLGDNYSAKGSFRIEEGELASLGLPPPKAFAVRANTLVIANTFGFHRRGDARPGKVTRLEIWAMSRVNPFNPWPGLGIGFFSDLRDRIFRGHLRRTRSCSRTGVILGRE